MLKPMSSDLEPLIAELENVTERMIATTCWELSGEFGELLESRRALSNKLLEREDLDAVAAARIRSVIEAGIGLVIQVLAMRESVLTAIAQTETERRFTCELGRTVPGQTQRYHVDMKV